MKLRFCSIFLLFLASLIAAGSEVTFSIKGKSEPVTISTIENGNIQLIALVPLLENLSFQCSWDKFTNKLFCTRLNQKIVFTQDSRFFTLNATVYQLPGEIVRKGAALYLPVTALSLISSLTTEFAIDDDVPPKKDIPPVVAASSKYTVSSAVLEKKQNGTLLTLVLTDSVPFDCTYFYPNLTINFLGGTVDPKALHQKERVGLADSLFALQYKKSAQISVILNREIEDPLIDYIQDTKTLLIALRQKKVKPKPASSQTKSRTALAGGNDLPSGLKTVVLDPGHGGKDPGAIGITGVKEKDVVLAITLKVRDLLKKNSNLKVLCTRDKDVFIPLSDRTKFANNNKADFFISIHADAVPGTAKRKHTTKGYKIYFLSQAKNEEDKLVAMRENAVIELEEKPQNYTSLQNVLIDLAGNEFLKESQEFCILLDQKFDASLDKRINKLHLGVGQANFWVLNGAFMPSVLVETGFLSNSDEERLLADKKFQDKIAMAIYNAIIGFQDMYGSGL
ncbi:MAG: N-acetylmuramoyl-L-alanine amidase [Fibrobacter sp.]|nr:N-acetylmuramoyl-L-alanine amidase [Fibrobacter sp.]